MSKMKLLVLGLTAASLAFAESPKVSDCFKVHSMIRADEEHYWTTWTNACPYTVDSVYVMVKFADQASREIADGVWSLHFIAPGSHRTMRFSAPGKIADFASVRTHRITSDLGEAFGRDPVREAQVQLAAVNTASPKIISDAGERVYAPPVPVPLVVAAPRPAIIIGDGGEAVFRSDYPDPWRAVLSAQETAVTPASHSSFVRFVSEEKHLYQ
jgi:hypothetical protein